MKKISRNPVIAYKQGFDEGIEQRRSEDIRTGVGFMGDIMLTALYNANIKEDNESVFLSDEDLRDFYLAVNSEYYKLFADIIAPDGTISNDDKVDLIVAHDKQIRRWLGLPEEGRDDARGEKADTGAVQADPGSD